MMKPSQLSSNVSNTARPAGDWSRYQENFARYLLGVAREYKRAVMAQLKASPHYPMLRLSFESVVTTLYAGPLRPKDIAARLGLSKQHASQLIGDVQRAGLVEKRADPHDHRARLVALTPLGQRLVVDGVRAAAEVSERFATEVGPEAMAEALRQTARLCDGLGLPVVATPWSALAATPPCAAPTSSAVRIPKVAGADVNLPRLGRGVIGEHLLRLADHVQLSLMHLCRQRGFDDLKLSDGQVLVHMSPAGVRLQELARYNDMSTQGVGRVVRELEQRGYVQRRADRDDARSKRIWLTERGGHLIATAVASVDVLRSQLLTLLGDDDFSAWLDVLRAIHDTVTLCPDAGDRCSPTFPAAGGEQVPAFGDETRGQLLLGIAQRLGPTAEPLPEALRCALGEGLTDDLERVLELLALRLGAR